MKILNKLKYLIIGALIMVGGTVFAVNLQPSFTPSLIPIEDSKYYLGSTSPARAWAGLNVYEICLSGDCKTAWPTGGGGSGGGSWSTTTSSVTGRLINYPNNTTDIVVIGGTATTTGATEYWFDPNTQNAHIGSSNTASTSVMGLFLLPTVGQGFLYGGTGGNVNAIASSSIKLSWFNNDAGFAVGTTTTIVCKTVGQCDYNTISSAISAGWRDIFVKDGTYAEQITMTNTKTKLRAQSLNTIIQCNGATQSPCVDLTDESVIDGFTLNETNAQLVGVAISGSDNSLTKIINNRINNFATSTQFTDSTSVTFYNTIAGNTLFNPKTCFEFSGTQANANWVNNNRCRPMAVDGGYGAYIVDSRGLFFSGNDIEGTTTAKSNIGVYFDASSRDNKIVGGWIEALGTGLSISTGANNINIDGTTISSHGTDIIDNGTNTRLLGVNRTGTKLFNIGQATSTNFSITNILSSVLKTNGSGSIIPASNGTDYTLITATTCSGTDRVSAIDASGNITCSATGSGGGSGSGTISTTTPLVSGQVAFSTGVSTIGNDSNFTFDSATDKLTVSLASTTGFSTSYASSTLGYIGSLFLPSVSQGYSYIGSNGLLNTISTSTLFSQINLFDLDTNTPFGTPLNSVYRIRSSFNNFLSNSSFESWLSGTSVAPSGWTLAGDATVSRSSTATINSYSAQVVFGTANTGELYQVIDTSTLVDYTFSAYVQRTSGTGNARLVAQRADAPFTEFVSVPLSTGGGWQLITLTVKPSAGTQTRFAIKSSDAVASTWLIDEAMFQEGKNLASTWLPAYIDDTNNQQVYGSKTFNALQTFNYSSSTIYSSFLTASSTFLNAGSITLATTTAGTVKTTSSGLFYVDTSAGGGGGVTSVTATYPIISSGGTTPAISIAFSTTTANIWSALNTFNGGLTIGTTTAGILRTNASGVVYASTATTTMSLFNDFTIPDSSGDVWLAPNSINSANSVSDQMVFVASSSVAKVGIHGSILIPSNFSSSSAKVRFAWTATSTSNAVVNDFDYRCVSGNNTTSLYQTSWQENKTVTTNNPSTAGYRITSTMDINAGYYCSAGDTMQFFLTRDGTDGSDTSTVDQEIFSASIDLLTQ